MATHSILQTREQIVRSIESSFPFQKPPHNRIRNFPKNPIYLAKNADKIVITSKDEYSFSFFQFDNWDLINCPFELKLNIQKSSHGSLLLFKTKLGFMYKTLIAFMFLFMGFSFSHISSHANPWVVCGGTVLFILVLGQLVWNGKRKRDRMIEMVIDVLIAH